MEGICNECRNANMDSVCSGPQAIYFAIGCRLGLDKDSEEVEHNEELGIYECEKHAEF